jgi:cytochrome c oxidase accessory protein FixG
VLLDPNTTVIAYDYIRGEPRGKIKKGNENNYGDCIDCNACVAVCPTGIDIREGTQLECVNCTACIDECDLIMDKVKKPRGLIRFASENNIRNKTRFRVTGRVIGYTAVLSLLTAILVFLLVSRKPIDVTILRAPGMIFQEQPGNNISNLYTMKLTNKTFDEVPVELKLENTEGEIKIIGSNIMLNPNDVNETKFLVLLPKEKMTKMNTPLEIGVYKNGERFDVYKTTFLGPGVQK